MTRYISNPDNLKLMMIMLKEKSRNIQFEAFHVFKVCDSVLRRRTTKEVCDMRGIVICKGKAVLLQAWTGPEGSRRLRLPDFKKIRT